MSINVEYQNSKFTFEVCRDTIPEIAIQSVVILHACIVR